ncbi:DUF6891 domain-containing protein [Sphingomonas sp. PB4P5]|uniref:DUF6891 domain-containing protein n=1 Tax=Parasphingomonas puruogangriensis TaxID=3096155 RepID=UPI002FC6D648
MLRSWLQRLVGQPLSSAAPAPAMSTEGDVAAEMRAHIDRAVATGFADQDDILQATIDAFSDEADAAAIERQAPDMIRQAFARHRAQQQSWPVLTDCDRLDAAFAALEDDGVIARQNFSCCGNCASTEIWAEIDDARDAGRPARGYAYYHMQDTESAAEGYGLYLGYGACAEGEAAALDVAREIIAQLSAHGLHSEWDGSITRRIAVPLDWKRRQTA